MSRTMVIVTLCVAGACLALGVALCVVGAVAIARFGWIALNCFFQYSSFSSATPQMCQSVNRALDLFWMNALPAVIVVIAVVVAVALAVLIVRQVRGRTGEA